MKIGLISGEFPPMPGGVGDFTRLLADQLSDLGHDLYIFSRPGSTSDALPITATAGWGIRALARMRSWALQNELDVVNLQFQTAAYDMSPWIHFLPRLIGVPLITTFHDLRFPYLFPKAGPLRNWIVMQLARSSAGAITTNEEDNRALSALPRRRLIPLGSSIPKRSLAAAERLDLRARAGAVDDAFLLGHFGFVVENKGIDYLIDALAQLRAGGHDARLLFIGERSNAVDRSQASSWLRDLDQQIAALDLDAAIHWTGYQPDFEVAAWLNAVDLMTLPFADGASYRSSSLVAAVHQGCAVLTTRPKTQIDAFKHAFNLWLIPPRSAAAIADAVLHLMRHRDQLRKLREGALQLRRQFDWQAIAHNTAAFYESCL